MTRLGALVVAASLSAPLPALAYTQADADACTPDAFRLCQQAIPDVGRVTACLTAKHTQLSPPCMSVFNRMRSEHTASSRTLDAQARPMAIHPAKF